MKRLILIASFMIGFGAMCNAQMMQKSPEKRAGHMTKVLQKRLNLSVDQAKQVNKVFINMASRMDSLKNNRSEDKKVNHLTAHRIRRSAEKQVMAVLDDSQKLKLAAWEKMRKERHRGRREDLYNKS